MMQNRNKDILSQFPWLFGLLIISIVSATFIFKLWLSQNGLDSYLMDTYLIQGDFIYQQMILTIAIFLSLTFVTYFTIAFKRQLRNKAENIITIASGFTFLTGLTITSNKLLRLRIAFPTGWTAYPPLSALTEASADSAASNHSHMETLTYLLTTLQFGITICLLFFTYSWGTKKHHG